MRRSHLGGAPETKKKNQRGRGLHADCGVERDHNGVVPALSDATDVAYQPSKPYKRGIYETGPRRQTKGSSDAESAVTLSCAWHAVTFSCGMLERHGQNLGG